VIVCRYGASEASILHRTTGEFDTAFGCRASFGTKPLTMGCSSLAVPAIDAPRCSRPGAGHYPGAERLTSSGGVRGIRPQFPAVLGSCR
jgi:hypothetical protein